MREGCMDGSLKDSGQCAGLRSLARACQPRTRNQPRWLLDAHTPLHG